MSGYRSGRLDSFSSRIPEACREGGHGFGRAVWEKMTRPGTLCIRLCMLYDGMDSCRQGADRQARVEITRMQAEKET